MAILRAMVTTREAGESFTGYFDRAAAADARPGVTYAVEAIGTFSLVFTVGMATESGSPFAPLGIGAVPMVMIYADGPLLGGHYNPAVTLAVLLQRRIGVRDAVGLPGGAGAWRDIRRDYLSRVQRR
jgi:glycerol uptake facilitator-like aquaporin